MRTVVPLGLSPSPSPRPSASSSSSIAANTPIISTPKSLARVKLFQNCGRGALPPQLSDTGINSRAGTCRASQAVDLFPSICPEIVVRDARVEDCWEVADTHCSSFFPNYTFPIDLVLRIDRFIALLSGFSVPPGSRRTCLVAVAGASGNDNLYIGSKDFKIGGFDGKFNLSRESVAGILTVDTLADYLPRKGPLRQKRTGIAYISNVAVRNADRRKGIAKLLIAKAEARALSWGCRSIALHCDVNNAAATRLYKSQGFKVIAVPDNSRWPQPKTAPNLQFYFMMKLLTSKVNI
ncbi:hypothetical protein KFK09_000103 [Dendrobium nobile]|uniref:N-acetyltransferase domain-containing protein n=1 Tax=Dendrobium nobile TaxID=94219 RepID=A0A8T3CCZ3_DENNO|nr:hypothetical protein KFK09_000103 [Dendrobium nobile]